MLVYAYIASALTAIIVGLIATPLAVKLGKALGFVSSPRDVEIERSPAADLGGLPVLIAILCATLVAYRIYPIPFEGYSRAVGGILLGTVIVAFMGFIDDRKNLGAGLKFGVQLCSVIVALYFGMRISYISNPFNTILELGVFSIPVTALWIVGMMNAVNFVDGLDGLAPGVLAIAALALFAISSHHNFQFLAIIFLAIFGANLAFLRFNYPPASIILGNMGAYSLGFLFATASIVQPVKAGTAMVLFIPLLALGFPMVEIIVTVLRRLVKRKKIYQRDAAHLHHVLLALGLPPSLVDWIFYSISLLFATVAVALSVGNRNIMIFFLAGLLFVFIVVCFKLAALERRNVGK